jgi:outer membrane protein OmpA-like peptidoglycan-associated protein
MVAILCCNNLTQMGWSRLQQSRQISKAPFMKKNVYIALACITLTALVGCETNSPPRALPRASTPVPGSSPGNTYGKGNPGDYTWTQGLANTQDQLTSTLRASGATVSQTNDNRLWITLPGDPTFEPGRSTLKPKARTQLDKIASYLRTMPNAEVRIVGHTDPKGSTATNNALSLERAASTRDWLVARGFPAMRTAVAGRGAADPIASNKDDTGRASNRRVEILIGQRRGE